MPPPVALIAGNGRLPVEVAARLAAKPGSVLVLAMEGEADLDALSAHDPVSISFGRLSRLFDAMGEAGCKSVVLAGGIVRRPDLRELALADWGTARTLVHVLGRLFAGDDALLGSVLDFIEKRGFTVLGIADVAPDLLLASGHWAGPKAKAARQLQIDLGVEATKALGRFDIGQGCIVVGRRVVAMEGAEGTDAMLARVERLREIGRLPAKRGGTLVKWPKPQQDLRVDLPAIGPETIRNVHLAGLTGIGVAAGRTVILDREALMETARRLRVAVEGFAP